MSDNKHTDTNSGAVRVCVGAHVFVNVAAALAVQIYYSVDWAQTSNVTHRQQSPESTTHWKMTGYMHNTSHP